MKVLVVGANGRTGLEMVREMHKRGHKVTSFVYGKAPKHLAKRSRVIHGDATIREQIDKAMKGQDVVVSVIGHIKNSSQSMQTKAISTIIRSMKQHKVKHIVSLTGTGVREPGDNPGPIDYLLNFAIKLIDPPRINDGIGHVEELKRRKGIDWTVVRVLKLGEGGEQEFHLSEHGKPQLITNRKTVAVAIANLCETKSWKHKLPIISNR